MAVSNRDQIGKGLVAAMDGLRPFVDRRLGTDWLAKHEAQERRAGRPTTVSDSDPRLPLLKINNEWNSFKEVLTPGDRARSQEIRDLANKFAHTFDLRAFTDQETVRGLETMGMLRGRPHLHQPADALTELIAAYSPCLILIDEWVSYARELLQPDLVGGSFETQFGFAQTLTEAVSAVPGHRSTTMDGVRGSTKN